MSPLVVIVEILLEPEVVVETVAPFEPVNVALDGYLKTTTPEAPDAPPLCHPPYPPPPVLAPLLSILS